MKKYIDQLEFESEVKIDNTDWTLIGCEMLGKYQDETIYRLGFIKEEDDKEPILTSLDISESLAINEESTRAIINLINRGVQYCFSKDELIMDEEEVKKILDKYCPDKYKGVV